MSGHQQRVTRGGIVPRGGCRIFTSGVAVNHVSAVQPPGTASVAQCRSRIVGTCTAEAQTYS